MRLIGLVVMFLVFTGWTLFVLASYGVPGLISLLSENGLAQQIFVDLCIGVIVAWTWLVPEAKRLGITPWGYLIVTPIVGSIALLAFLIQRELILRRSVTPGATASAAR